MKPDTWILVADSSHAQLYGVVSKGAPLTMVKAYTHGASRITGGGLTTDQPGRTHGSVGSAQSSMESKTSPKEVEIERFAHELAEVLHAGHGQQLYSHLVLVAPPHFLGLLRQKINATISKLITATLDKDYTQLSEADLQDRLLLQLVN